MVNMETWIPAQLDTMPLLNSHDVKECGSIAPPGHFGWFVPVSLSRLGDNWATFAKRETAARFDVDELTLDNVRNFTMDPVTKAHYCQESFCQDGMYIPEWCRGEPCALLFTGYSNVTDFVRDHIDRMKLYVKVIWVGPELKHVTETLTENLTSLNSAAPAGNRYLAHFFVHALVLVGIFIFTQARVRPARVLGCLNRNRFIASESGTIYISRNVFEQNNNEEIIREKYQGNSNV